MADDEIARFLVRTALDDAFCELARTDPDEAFEDFDLDAEERRILSERGPEMLQLITRAVQQLSSGESRERGGLASPVDPEPEAADEAGENEPILLPEVSFNIRIAPKATWTEDGRLELNYTTALQPMGSVQATAPPRPAEIAPGIRSTASSWDHRPTAIPTRRAARAVLDATPEDRPGLLLELLAVMSGAAEGEDGPNVDLPSPGSDVDIHVVGTGIVNVDHLTRETERAFRTAEEVLVADTGVATIPFVETLNPAVTNLFDGAYLDEDARLNTYHHMASRVLDAALRHQPVTFAIHGHPVVFSYPPFLVHDAAALLGLRVKTLPGISSMDCLFAELMLDPGVEGIQMMEATDMLVRRRPLTADMPALIWQVGTVETRLHTDRPSRPERFKRFQAWLLLFYPLDHPLVAVYSTPHQLAPSQILRFTIAELPAHAHALHAGFTLYVPSVGQRPVQDEALRKLVDSPQHLRSITR